jgi:RNA polymerase sigma factor (TIGR02999 family)
MASALCNDRPLRAARRCLGTGMPPSSIGTQLPIVRDRMNAPEPSDEPLTLLLRRAASGEADAGAAALPRVYHELRRIARGRMMRERADHTLQATALVHETWMRLVGVGSDWSDRAAFYRAAATAMRRILVEHARRRARIKRGGGAGREPISIGNLPAPMQGLDGSAAFLHLDEQIQRLEQEDPRAGEIVRLRFFAGLGVDETAAALGLSRRTVLREWAFARAWLFEALDEGERRDA